MIALYIIMVLCICCRQLCSLLYVLNAVFSCFVHLIVPEAAANSIFPLSLAFILAPGIDKSCLCLSFSSFKDVYRNAGKGTHSCNVCVAGSVGMVLPLRLVLTELIL